MIATMLVLLAALAALVAMCVIVLIAYDRLDNGDAAVIFKAVICVLVVCVFGLAAVFHA